jgi:DNA-directed RNA polymerase specialized sigma24 family protein
VLRYFDDLNRHEIAEVLGISTDLVRSRRYEARQELRQLLERAERE